MEKSNSIYKIKDLVTNKVNICIGYMRFMSASNNKFINQTEVSIHLFRLYNIKKEYNTALIHIKNAIDKPVINSEVGKLYKLMYLL